MTVQQVTKIQESVALHPRAAPFPLHTDSRPTSQPGRQEWPSSFEGASSFLVCHLEALFLTMLKEKNPIPMR